MIAVCGLLPVISALLIPNDAGAILPLEVGVLSIAVAFCKPGTALLATFASLFGHHLDAVIEPSPHHHGLWIAAAHLSCAWLSGILLARAMRRRLFSLRRHLPRVARWYDLGVISLLATLQSIILANHQTQADGAALSSLWVSQWLISACTYFVMQRASLALLTRPRLAWDPRERGLAALSLASLSLFTLLIALSLIQARATRCDDLDDLLTFASSQLQGQLLQGRNSLELARLIVDGGGNDPSVFSQELETLGLRDHGWLSQLYWVDLSGSPQLRLGFPAERVFHRLGHEPPLAWTAVLEATQTSPEVHAMTLTGATQKPQLVLGLATRTHPGAVVADINLSAFLSAFKQTAQALSEGARLELRSPNSKAVIVDLGTQPRTIDLIQSERRLLLGDLDFRLHASTEPYPQHSWSLQNPHWQLASLLLFSALLTQLGAAQRKRRLDNVKQHRLRAKHRRQTKQLHEQLLASERHLGFEGVLSTISHELATPLGIAQLALDDLQAVREIPPRAIDGQQRNNGQAASAATFRRMEQALGQARALLRKYRLHSNTKSYTSTQLVNLVQLLRDFVELMQPHCAQCGVTIQLHGRTEAVHVMSKPSLIKQVCMALVNNALDHAFAADQANPSIRIELRSYVDYNLIIIRDNGSGVPAQLEKVMFDPFTTGRSHQGHRGLGLYIARTIVENELHGKIRAVSSASGTAMQVELPAYSEAAIDAHVVS